MGLHNIGYIPGERKLAVNSAPGPTEYSAGVGGGVKVRMDFKTLPNIYGIVGVWLFGDVPKYSYCVGAWSENMVSVRLGNPNVSIPESASGSAKVFSIIS